MIKQLIPEYKVVLTIHRGKSYYIIKDSNNLSKGVYNSQERAEQVCKELNRNSK